MTIEEREVLLAEALWSKATEEQKQYIRDCNRVKNESYNILTSALLELNRRTNFLVENPRIVRNTVEDDIEQSFKKRAVQCKLMTEAMFEALMIAYYTIE